LKVFNPFAPSGWAKSQKKKGKKGERKQKERKGKGKRRDVHLIASFYLVAVATLCIQILPFFEQP